MAESAPRFHVTVSSYTNLSSWVLGDSVSSSSHSIFTASESSTYQELSGETWDITYGDGSFASGIVGTDTIEIGGKSLLFFLCIKLRMGMREILGVVQ